MTLQRPIALLSSLGLVAALAACGGGSGGDATIGGTITGLGSGRTLVLANNSTDLYTITGSTGTTSVGFEFAKTVAAGGAFAVTVNTQPLGQNCAVTNGSGNVDSSGNNVTTVKVACALSSSVVGTISGVATGTAAKVRLAGTYNGAAITKDLTVADNGNFSFEQLLDATTTYTVTVVTPPKDEVCSVTSGSGTVVAGTSTGVTVACN